MSEQATEPTTSTGETQSPSPAAPPAMRIDGPLRLTLNIDELRAINNPELFGKGDWELRLWINGIERWRSEELVYAGEGESVRIGAVVHTEVPDFTEQIELRAKATEVDLVNPDEHVSGTATLQRTLGFHSGASFTIDLKDGDKAHVRLTCSVDTEPM
jgi:hypothetical protein